SCARWYVTHHPPIDADVNPAGRPPFKVEQLDPPALRCDGEKFFRRTSPTVGDPDDTLAVGERFDRLDEGNVQLPVVDHVRRQNHIKLASRRGTPIKDEPLRDRKS